MKRSKLLTATVVTFALALTVWTIGATVNLSTIGFSVNEGDVVSAADFNNAFAMVDNNFSDVQGAVNSLHNDRPGVTNAYDTTETVLTATTQEIASVTIEAPAAGIVVVRATGYFDINHTQASGDDVPRAYLSDTSADQNFDNLAIFTVDTDQPSNSAYYSSWTIEMLDEVPAAGSYTYFLNGDHFAESSVGANIIENTQLIATYYPTTYGTVTATSMGGSATSATGTSPDGN